MKRGLWEFVKKPENVPYLIGIPISFLVSIWGLFKVISAEVLVAAVLLVLSSIASLLIILQSSIYKFQKQWESPSIGEILKPFHEMEDEIRLNLRTADEIWLLSRTGCGWWNNFNNEFERALNKKNKARFLFLDPDNGALKMVVNSGIEIWEKYEENFDKILTSTNCLFSKHNNDPFLAKKIQTTKFLDFLITDYGDKICLKVIDHLPAWTLLIINPNKKTG